MYIIPFLARQKFRFDIGQGLAAIINMGLITISAAPHIAQIIPLPSWLIATVILPVSLFAVWLAGYIWERVGGFREYTTQLNNHNEILKKLEKEG